MKNIELNKFLVPHDFTQQAKEAFEYALSLSKHSGGEIILVHMVDEEEEIPEAEEKLNTFKDNYAEWVQKNVTTEVAIGDIFTDLEAVAERYGAATIVMGKHERTTWEKMFGSNALKVVASAHTPFIIVPEDQGVRPITNIVMPFSFERKSLQVTQVVTSLAKKFRATIHLVGYPDSDESLMKEMKINQGIVQKHLVESGVAHKVFTLTDDATYLRGIQNYAKDIKADLFAAAYFDKSMLNFTNSFVESLLVNELEIPVLTVNGPEVMVSSPKLDYVPVQ